MIDMRKDPDILATKRQVLNEISKLLEHGDNRESLGAVCKFTEMMLAEYAVTSAMAGKSKREIGENIGEILTQIDNHVTMLYEQAEEMGLTKPNNLYSIRER